MFRYDGNLCLHSIDLWVDSRAAKPLGFISHAHSDHIARHRHVYATPETIRLCQERLGKRPATPMPYRTQVQMGDIQLTTFPAGHIFGSAMLYAEADGESLLYTGDFRLKPAMTCAPADPPEADLLIMECTYGHPRYRFPDRRGVAADFIAAVKQAIDRGVTPVVQVYSLGKAQEATRLLADAGVPVMAYGTVFKMNEAYRELGMPLGAYAPWDPSRAAGHACIVPPMTRNANGLRKLGPVLTIQLTGWTIDRGAGYRWGVDCSFPLSDHADFDELLDMVRRVNPRRVYCTHGPEKFARLLQAEGWSAAYLGQELLQPMLF